MSDNTTPERVGSDGGGGDVRRARTTKVIGGWHVSRLVIDWCDWRFGVWVNRSPIGTDVWLCIGPLVVSFWERRGAE